MKKIILFLLVFVPFGVWAQLDSVLTFSGASTITSTKGITTSLVSSGLTVSVQTDIERFFFFVSKNGASVSTSYEDAKDAPVYIRWYSSNVFTSISIDNLTLSNEDFEKLATFISGDESKILAFFTTYETDVKGKKRLISMRISFADSEGNFPVNKKPTYDDLQTVKKIVKEYFKSNK